MCKLTVSIACTGYLDCHNSVEPYYLPEAYSPPSLQHFHEPLLSTSEYRWTYLAPQTLVRIKLQTIWAEGRRKLDSRHVLFWFQHKTCNASWKIYSTQTPGTEIFQHGGQIVI